jgi:hypothetical protein
VAERVGIGPGEEAHLRPDRGHLGAGLVVVTALGVALGLDHEIERAAQIAAMQGHRALQRPGPRAQCRVLERPRRLVAADRHGQGIGGLLVIGAPGEPERLADECSLGAGPEVEMGLKDRGHGSSGRGEPLSGVVDAPIAD